MIARYIVGHPGASGVNAMAIAADPNDVRRILIERGVSESEANSIRDALRERGPKYFIIECRNQILEILKN